MYRKNTRFVHALLASNIGLHAQSLKTHSPEHPSNYGYDLEFH